jgi:psp operon transcriptional activator
MNCAYHPATSTDSAAAHVEALGQSEAFLSFINRISQVAPINRSVLLIGERGSGKELAAARLHFLSDRWQGPFIALNCAALTRSLIESELFGYEKGAFTGAEQRRAGRFERADGGTLFLDEIGNIPVQVQAKILRVVEYNNFERVGGTRPVQVDVRIIGATNADLPQMAANGRFKQDLLDRLAFEVLKVPALRERTGDIDLLCDHFARQMALELNRKDMPRFSRTARGQLRAYDWPGNIRELKNVVERAVYRTPEGLIEHIDINPFPVSDKSPGRTIPLKQVPSGGAKMENPGSNQTLKEAVQDLTIRMLKNALQKTRYNHKKAARLLGLSYDQMRGLKRKYADHLKECEKNP